MHTVHAGYSIVAKIKKDHVDKTRSLLTALNKSPGTNPKLPLDKSLSTHFVQGTILPEQQYNQETLPATLIIATSFFGPRKKHLDELIDIGSTGLSELFANCENFTPDTGTSVEALRRFIVQHRHWDTYYTGMQYSTKSDVFREHKFRKLIGNYIDSTPELKVLPPKETKHRIKEHVKQNLKWASKPSKRTFWDHMLPWWSLVLLGLISLFLVISFLASFISDYPVFRIGCLLFLLAIVFLGIVVFFIRSYEKKELSEEVAARPTDEKVKSILGEQSGRVINTMSVSGSLKKGYFRRIFFRIALKGVASISGIRKILFIPTVYTARWMSIDKGKRLVFLSNFTDTSESYVRDFIDNKSSAKKINLLFGQGTGYPITKWIFGDGALNDPNAFLYEVMTNHHSTDFWYCPYPQISLENIKTNKQIYKGLCTDFSTDEEINEWLNLF